MTFVILTGGIDLSVGSIVAVAGVVLGLAIHSGVPVSLSIVLAMAAGAACGAVNGSLVTLGRLPPFIATLGMMSVARGAALMLTDGRPISDFPASLRVIATGHIAGAPFPVILMPRRSMASRTSCSRAWCSAAIPTRSGAMKRRRCCPV